MQREDTATGRYVSAHGIGQIGVERFVWKSGNHHLPDVFRTPSESSRHQKRAGRYFSKTSHGGRLYERTADATYIHCDLGPSGKQRDTHDENVNKTEMFCVTTSHSGTVRIP